MMQIVKSICILYIIITATTEQFNCHLVFSKLLHIMISPYHLSNYSINRPHFLKGIHFLEVCHLTTSLVLKRTMTLPESTSHAIE